MRGREVKDETVPRRARASSPVPLEQGLWGGWGKLRQELSLGLGSSQKGQNFGMAEGCNFRSGWAEYLNGMLVHILLTQLRMCLWQSSAGKDRNTWTTLRSRLHEMRSRGVTASSMRASQLRLRGRSGDLHKTSKVFTQGRVGECSLAGSYGTMAALVLAQLVSEDMSQRGRVEKGNLI